MAKNLVIVESPAKAKTIEKFLGKDFIVKSCFGHIRDLPKDNNAIDLEKGYLPKYVVPDDKKKVVKELKQLAKKAEIIWLASDEDREGEAISWHLAEELDIPKEKQRRIVFHEITKKAILSAIENPRDIDDNLVNAQQARRILDRLVGFELSPVLWKKVRPSLSAGRVQSVAVRLIVEKERSIEQFKPEAYFQVLGQFETEGKNLNGELNRRVPTEEEVNTLFADFEKASFAVEKTEVKPGTKKPAPPFTTSTLQQEASRKLGYSVSKTMTLAQRLYEAGHITYMRTDSVNLSDFALEASKNEINSYYGEEYLKTRKYSTKSSGAQEAHEAIRPTVFDVHSAGADSSQEKLYQLIWKRSIASQMSEAKIEKTTITINNDVNDEKFQAKGEVVKFDGFLKVYTEGKDDEEDETIKGLLPAIDAGQALNKNKIEGTQKYTRPPYRYSEASLVKRLEELGIGRPSTYAPTISTIQKREYVIKEPIEGKTRNFIKIVLDDSGIQSTTNEETYGADKNKLHPSDIGKIVTEFLSEHFEKIMDYNFTANVEKEFDEIANGFKDWSNMIDNFYNPFHKNVETTLETAKKANGERLLGIDPESGKNVYAKVGRYGAMIQIGDTGDEEEKPKFASLVKGQRLETVTLDDALTLFQLPRKLGKFEDAEVTVSIGRYGPYFRQNNAFFSLGEDQDPFSVTLEEAIVAIEAKRKEDANKTIATFGDILVLNGRYGPYIKQEKKNYKIPKDKDAATLTEEECKEIIANAPAKKSRARKQK
jgi:DNA topoisomerase-1